MAQSTPSPEAAFQQIQHRAERLQSAASRNASRAGEEALALQRAGIDLIVQARECRPDQFAAWTVDAAQRWVLFWDVLRQRGNNWLEREAAGRPPVLIFDYEVLIDGRELPRPVNYALAAITPPKGVVVDPARRPYVIIDPRAGHGSGIGGFKDDSQVGVALRAGHPVYFVLFWTDPVKGQTLRDVAAAEARFIRHVAERHPDARKPCIVGNCQGGWAVMALAAADPNITGPIVINGAPLSYWAGQDGRNPMRYTGGLTGGSWPAQLLGDLGAGTFDGANLVANFEKLNPSATQWSKYTDLFHKVDTEDKRFLDFERWWGGFTLMNSEEMRSIVDNLFVGNKLQSGQISVDRAANIDLRQIKAPIIVFCSEGDNITPPQQALNWIADVYKDVREIKSNGQTIVYLVHADVGHLGIFVSGAVARKEHTEIVSTLQQIEQLPPGLYEMLIKEVGVDPGTNRPKYDVTLEERSMEDLTQEEDHGKQDESEFEIVRRMSDLNGMIYDMFVSPVVRAMATEKNAEFMRMMHPMRMQRWMISDKNPFLAWIAPAADAVRANRQKLELDHPGMKLEQSGAETVAATLDLYRDVRDGAAEVAFHAIYGTLGSLGIPGNITNGTGADTSDEEPRDAALVAQTLAGIEHGDQLDALIRMMLLLLSAQQSVSRGALARVQQQVALDPELAKLDEAMLSAKMKVQSIIVAYDPARALSTLPALLPSGQRTLALERVEKFLAPAKDRVPALTEMLERITEVLTAP